MRMKSDYHKNKFEWNNEHSMNAEDIPSGVSGSPAFLPGRSPNHFGRRAEWTKYEEQTNLGLAIVLDKLSLLVVLVKKHRRQKKLVRVDKVLQV